MKNAQILVLVALFVSPVLADFDTGNQTVELHGGLSSTSTEYEVGPYDSDVRAADPGYAAGGQYIYYFHTQPTLGVGIDASYQHLSDHHTDQFIPNTDARFNLRSTDVLGVVKLAFPRGHWRPYVFLGLGAGRTSQLIAATPTPGNVWTDTQTAEERRFYDDDATQFAFGLGGGIDFFPNERFFWGFEIRDLFLARASFNPTPTGMAAGLLPTDDRYSLVNVLFHVGMKWGSFQ